MRAVVYDRYGPPEVLTTRRRRAAWSQGRRSPRQGSRDDGHQDRHRTSQRRVLHQPVRHRVAPTQAEDPRTGIRRRGRGGRRSRQRVRDRRSCLRRPFGSARGARLRSAERRARAHPGGHDLRGGGSGLRRSSARARLPETGRRPGRAERSRVRRLRVRRNGSRAAGQALRRSRHRGLQHEERRARALARRRRGRSTTCGRTSPRTARRTTSCSTRSASTRSGGRGDR